MLTLRTYIHRSTAYATPLPHTPHVPRTYLGIFGVLRLIPTTIPSGHLHVVLLGTVVAHTAVVWHGFGAWVLQERKGEKSEEYVEVIKRRCCHGNGAIAVFG